MGVQKRVAQIQGHPDTDPRRFFRIVVTMGMPALVYRWFFFAHGLRSFERNILALAAIGPTRSTRIGDASEKRRGRIQDHIEQLPQDGA